MVSVRVFKPPPLLEHSVLGLSVCVCVCVHACMMMYKKSINTIDDML